MDDLRKKAYRYLLYHAMLEIRQLEWLRLVSCRFWNPFRWRTQAKQIRRCGMLADWLHNLALFSAIDFHDFDEARFWEDHDRVRRHCPELEKYRTFFEQRLSGDVSRLF